MRAFSPAELSSMRLVQHEAMMDLCTLRTRTASMDEYGTEIDSWSDIPLIPCGLDVSVAGGREVRRPDGTYVFIAATLRLSLGDGGWMNEEDRVTITHRNSEPLSPPMVYGIDGVPLRGPTGFVLRLVEIR